MDKLKLLGIQGVQQDCMKDFFKAFDNINNVRAFENFSEELKKELIHNA